MKPPRAVAAASVLGAHLALALALWSLAPARRAQQAARLAPQPVLNVWLHRPAVAPATRVMLPLVLTAPRRANWAPEPRPLAVPVVPVVPVAPAPAVLPAVPVAPVVAESAEPLPLPAGAAVTPPPRAEAAPAPMVATGARPDHAFCASAAHPAPLRERGVEGVVRVRVMVSAEGRAQEVLLAHSSGWRLFDEAALQQARGCRYLPARRDGLAVESWVEFPVRFALAG